MFLRVELPKITAAVDTVRVVQWHRQVGDRVGYGEPLLDVVAEEVTRLRRRLTAGAALVEEGRGKAKYRKLKDVSVPYRISSLDSGSLSSVLVGVGTLIREGDLVALLSSADGAPDGQAEGAPRARLVVNRVDPTVELEDE